VSQVVRATASCTISLVILNKASQKMLSVCLPTVILLVIVTMENKPEHLLSETVCKGPATSQFQKYFKSLQLLNWMKFTSLKMPPLYISYILNGPHGESCSQFLLSQVGSSDLSLWGGPSPRGSPQLPQVKFVPPWRLSVSIALCFGLWGFSSLMHWVGK
jgi:hypothetical protein